MGFKSQWPQRQQRPDPTWPWPARWSCLREAAGPPSHFSPTASCCSPPKLLRAGGNSSCLLLASCFLVISSAHKHIGTRTVSLHWQARHYIASWGRKGGLLGGGAAKVGEELSGWIADRGWDSNRGKRLAERLVGWTRLELNGHHSCMPDWPAGWLGWLTVWIKLYWGFLEK